MKYGDAAISFTLNIIEGQFINITNQVLLKVLPSCLTDLRCYIFPGNHQRRCRGKRLARVGIDWKIQKSATPRRRRLPPLGSLRAFEVVARHLSIAKAAEELFVTPAAVSQQIRTLEDHLGVPLLRRNGRNLLLTDAGEACLPGIRDGFQRLSAAVDLIDHVGEAGIVTVSVAPSFAVKWLVPRLDRFQARHPDIDVRVAASNELTDFASDDVDLAIRYGGGRYPDLVVERLLSESIFPVCSPQLLARSPIQSPADLRSQTLLHDDSPDDDQSCPNWQMWLRAAKESDVDWNRGLRFTQSSLVLEAAIHGKGVALAKATLAEADLEEGRLVRLFQDQTPVDFAYYIVSPARKIGLPKVAAFAEWLKEEATSGSLLPRS